VYPVEESLEVYPPRVIGKQNGKKCGRRVYGMASTISGRKGGVFRK
jgi:hypothetical protein